MLAEIREESDNLLAMTKSKKKRTGKAKPEPSRGCMLAGPPVSCERPHYSKGFCQYHYQRSRPRADGSVPSIEEVAGVVRHIEPRPHHLTGRGTDAVFAKLKRAVKMGRAESIHDLMSRLAARYDPETDQLQPPEAQQQAA